MNSKSVDSSERARFDALGLNPALVQALAALGYEEPTPIQREAIPFLLEGRDVLGQAATGTGKTAAFALPLLHRVKPEQCRPFETSALILVPTRELAIQVAEAVYSYGKVLGVGVLPVYGGQEFSEQVRRLKRGIDVVVATPGRALDHLRRKTLKLERVEMVVLDEADEMLDLGFAEDLDAILAALPKKHQTALFSATLPPRIAAMAERHLSEPARIQIAREKPAPGAMPRVRQNAYIVTKAQKDFALRRVLDAEAVKSAIVFCRTRVEVDALTDSLQALGFRAEPLHGGMTQEQRERVLKRFRGGKADLLVATDVAARGLHIDKLSHVINYDLPTAPEAYVHRIGRTGRAGQEGVAISFAEPRERRLLGNIEKLTRQKIAIASLPSVADLEVRRLEQTRNALKEVLDAGGLDPFRSLVEGLVSEFPVADIAAAAVKIVHTASARPPAEGEPDELIVPEPSKRSRSFRDEEGPRSRGPARSKGKGERPPPEKKMTTLFIGVGRQAGIRPADIVGAIANEVKIPPRDVGAIEIDERHSTVQVPDADATRVMVVLRGTTLRGRRFAVNRHKA